MQDSPPDRDQLPADDHIDWHAFGRAAAIAAVLWLLVLGHSCSQRDADDGAANKLVDHGHVPEHKDTRAIPPLGRVAVFESVAPEGVAAAFAINGVDYDVTYIDPMPPGVVMASIAGRKGFVANFVNGTRRGNPREADVIVVIGTAKVVVGDLNGYARRRDDMEETIGPDRAMPFWSDVGPRGEPSTFPWTTRKRLIVVGRVQGIERGGATSLDESGRALSLKPSPRDIEQYKRDLHAYDVAHGLTSAIPRVRDDERERRTDLEHPAGR